MKRWKIEYIVNMLLEMSGDEIEELDKVDYDVIDFEDIKKEVSYEQY